MKLNRETVMPAMTLSCTENDSLDLDTLNYDPRAQLKLGVSGTILGRTPRQASTLAEEEKGIPAQNAADTTDDRCSLLIKNYKALINNLENN